MCKPWLLLPDQLPEHVRKDPAVCECNELLRRIDAYERLELVDLVAVNRANGDRPRGTEPVGDPGHRIQLVPAEAQG